MRSILSISILLACVQVSFAQPPDTLWTRTYGGSDDDWGQSVQQTADGGYIVAGETHSFGSASGYFYLVKTNSQGETLWTRTYGASGDEGASCVQQTTDGGYILAGSSDSFGAGDYYDVYLVKTDSQGDTLWTRTYGGNSEDHAYCVEQTTDGGYILAGYTYSFGAGTPSYGNMYLVKTDCSGDTLWTRTYGGSSHDYGRSIQQTADGGYIVAGYTNSFGAGWIDFYVVKTNGQGDTLWTRTYGGNGGDMAFSVQRTADGGYIIAGSTYFYGSDFYLVKTNSQGDTLWTRTYGRNHYDYPYSIQRTADGGYIVAGETAPFATGIPDFYVVKTNSQGDTLWTRTYGGSDSDEAYSVQQTTDGGYIVAGYTNSFGAGGYDFYLVKTGPDPAWYSIVGLSPIDPMVSVNEDITFSGRLVDGYGEGVPWATIGIADGLTSQSTWVTTDATGHFEYSASASRPGIYHTEFFYAAPNGHIYARRNSNARVGYPIGYFAMFKTVQLYNPTNYTLNAHITYNGPLCASDPTPIEQSVELLVPAGETIVAIDGSEATWNTDLLDDTPGEGDPVDPPVSAGWKFCSVPAGGVNVCVSGPVGEGATTFEVHGGEGFVIGGSYDWTTNDFCVDMGTGGGVPTVSGSLTFNFCTDGLYFSVGGIVGVAGMSWSVRLDNPDCPMCAITGYVRVDSPVDLLMQDNLGRFVGVNSSSGTIVNSIPRAFYTGPAAEPQVIRFPLESTGIYGLAAAGVDTGRFTIVKRVFANQTVLEEQLISDVASPGEQDTFSVPMDSVRISPEAPTDLVVIPQYPHFLVSWSAVQNAIGYRIYYDTDTTGLPYYGCALSEGCSPVTIANVTEAVVTPTHAGPYYFAVAAMSSDSTCGALSDEVVAVPIVLPAPTNLVIRIEGSDLLLNWMSVPGATEYLIYFATEPYDDIGQYSFIGIVYEPFYTHVGGASGEKGFYRVVAR